MSVGYDIHEIGRRWITPGGPPARVLAAEVGISVGTLRRQMHRAGYTVDAEELAERRGYINSPEEPAKQRRAALERADQAWKAALEGQRFVSVRVAPDPVRLPLPETHVHTQSSAA